MGRHQPLRFDTPPPNHNLPITMWVRLMANQFHPLKKETKEMSANNIEQCVDPSKILEIRKDKNCTNNCIPTIFSSLFDMSTLKECPDYKSHFCALEDLFGYVWERNNQCTKPGAEKYFDGTVDIDNGISYAYWASAVNFSAMGNDGERGRTLFALQWDFVSPYVNNREEVLVYGGVDLISWLGGAIGVFGGYSIYDLSSQIIDAVFSLISRFSNTNI